MTTPEMPRKHEPSVYVDRPLHGWPRAGLDRIGASTMDLAWIAGSVVAAGIVEYGVGRVLRLGRRWLR